MFFILSALPTAIGSFFVRVQRQNIHLAVSHFFRCKNRVIGSDRVGHCVLGSVCICEFRIWEDMLAFCFRSRALLHAYERLHTRRRFVASVRDCVVRVTSHSVDHTKHAAHFQCVSAAFLDESSSGGIQTHFRPS